MIKIPVDSYSYQEQTFDVGTNRLRLTLRYNSIGDHWAMDVYDVRAERYDVQGLAIVLGVPMMWRSTTEYFFWANDLSAVGIDAVGGRDLGSRIELLCGLKSEVNL